MIKKGSNVGRRVSNHKRSPSFEASRVFKGKRSKNKKKIHRKQGVKSFFKGYPGGRFVYFMSGKRKREVEYILKIVLKPKLHTYK